MLKEAKWKPNQMQIEKVVKLWSYTFTQSQPYTDLAPEPSWNYAQLYIAWTYICFHEAGAVHVNQ